MLPSILVAATLAVPVETPFGIRGQFRFKVVPVSTEEGWSVDVPLCHPVLIEGKPQHYRGTVWDRSSQLGPNERAVPFNPFAPQKPTPVAPAKVPPLDPTAERIKAIEDVILEMKAGGGSAAVIEQLQRDLDELKKKK